MVNLIEKIDIVFDENNNTIISKDQLLKTIKEFATCAVFSEELPSQWYILMDRNHKDFYPFNASEIQEWEKDGSCEKGDTLYQMQFVKTY